MAKTKLGGNQLRFSPDHAFTGSAGVTRAAIVDTAAGLVLSSSRVYLGQDPADNLEAATKQYVDSQTGGSDVDKKQIMFGAADGSGFDSTTNAILTAEGKDLGITGSALFGPAAAKRLLISSSNGSGMQIKVDGPVVGSSNLTFDVAGNIVLNADAGVLEFADGSDSLLKISNASEDVSIQPQQANKDVVFLEDGGNEIARFDSSAESLLMKTTKKIALGTSQAFIHASNATNEKIQITNTDSDGDIGLAIDVAKEAHISATELCLTGSSSGVKLMKRNGGAVVFDVSGVTDDAATMGAGKLLQLGGAASKSSLHDPGTGKLKIIAASAGDLGIVLQSTAKIHAGGTEIALSGSAGGVKFMQRNGGAVVMDVAGTQDTVVTLQSGMTFNSVAGSTLNGAGGVAFESATTFSKPTWSESFASFVISSSLNGHNESTRAPSGKGFSSIIPYVGSVANGNPFGAAGSSRAFFVTGTAVGTVGQQLYRDSVEVYVNGVRLMSGTAAEATAGTVDYSVSGSLAGPVAARTKDALAINLGGGVFVNGDVLTIQAGSRSRTQ